jgi:2-polyprenyl-3-methyl-5-hydroxy-6-metoxy-1,4-benzoquinol methylase
LPEQIAFANAHFKTSFREFRHLPSVDALKTLPERFDCITSIEVIEHLTEQEASNLLSSAAALLKPGGGFVFSTPNYTSLWPLIEVLLNKFGDVNYKEQHLTKFNYFTMVPKLRKLLPKFDETFEVEFKTTTHMIAPFLAAFSLERAQKISRMYPHQKWHFPFGNLIVVSLKKRAQKEVGASGELPSKTGQEEGNLQASRQSLS